MKKALVILSIASVISIIGAVVAVRQAMYSQKKYEVAMANIRSYESLFDTQSSKTAAFQLTINQLRQSRDSIVVELERTQKELKVKDKNLKALQQVSSSFSKKDTIYLDKIVFKEPSFKLDTLLGDKWYTLRLGLQYPSMVATEPYFKSEKHIVVSSKKETVNPPKKFFLFRWFQKKMTVVHVVVVEKNPYAKDEGTRYVEVLH